MSTRTVPVPTTLEAVLRRDRSIVIAGLIGVAVLAWAYMIHMAWHMESMDMAMDMAMPQMKAWGPLELAAMFIMWSVMMVAMMVPSASPMILLFARMNRKRKERHDPFVPTTFFLIGYLLVWTGFSAVATLAQWGLHAAALLSSTMVATSPLLGGLLLAAAGVFQWTPLKRACLVHCRSPLHFFMAEWKDGKRGGLRMGLKHGSYCVGCCWILMALLFVAGVMNLLWVAVITVFVLVEKVSGRGELVGRVAGVALVLAGVGMAFW